MTPKEKAKELVQRFIDAETLKDFQDMDMYLAKQCALICVDEMIKQNGELYLNGIDEQYYRKKNAELFEVKQEIEKL